MDAPEEKDIALQQTSSDLLLQCKRSLPRFLWRSSKAPDFTASKKPSHIRARVRTQTTAELGHLLEPFQEWPQLLDPDLNQLLTPLIDAYLATLLWVPKEYDSHVGQTGLHHSSIPLPQSICKLLYIFCKIRGPKVISRFFNNEPMYLELMLDAFSSRRGLHHLERNAHKQANLSSTGLAWEEKYIMLLWLSHLLLAPFDLASIGSSRPCEIINPVRDIQLPPGLPALAVRLMTVGMNDLISAGKEREAAVLLLTRLALRPDMIDCGLLHTLVEWAIKTLHDPSLPDGGESIYTHIGTLSFLASTLTLADAATLVPFLIPIFDCTQFIIAGQAQQPKNILSSAIARKLLIKILRSITVIALKLDSTTLSQSHVMLENVLEQVVQHALSSLADKDTPVRFAGSKALSVITLSLKCNNKVSMAEEVIEAVLATLEEKVLWVATDSFGTRGGASIQGKGPGSKKRDLSAVDPLQWQGLILTLSHMLFRASVSRSQLPQVLAALILAIGFEQRSTSGASIGTSVRDAACFGIWSLARRYSTPELMAVDGSILSTGRLEDASVIQIIADELVVAASLDPSGNIRRGASAALQELIGRHPDTIIQGISIVHVVDYHAVALRSRAMKEVALYAAKLDNQYWDVVRHGLLSWRAIDTPDISSRRYAGEALGLLSTLKGWDGRNMIVESILNSLNDRKSREIGKRHGLLLAAAAVLTQTVTADQEFVRVSSSSPAWRFWKIFESRTIVDDKDFTSSTLKPALTAESVCTLISALAKSCRHPGSFQPTREMLTACLHFVDLSLTHTDEAVLYCASKASDALFNLLDDSWRLTIVSEWVSRILVGNSAMKQRTRGLLGYLAALGAVFRSCSSQPTLQHSVVEAILDFYMGGAEVEARVGALRCLSAGVLPSHAFTAEIAEITAKGLQDYTTDQRGDIGSLVRIEGISVVHTAWKHHLLTDSPAHQKVVGLICGLAVEKLDKVRHLAWVCLQDTWCLIFGTIVPARHHDLNQTSSPEYYRQIMSLLSVPWVRAPLVQGLVTSAGIGSESLLCITRATLLEYLEQADEKISILLWQDLLSVLQLGGQKDRLTIPTLEVLSFLLGNSLWDHLDSSVLNWHEMFLQVQKAHYRSGNVHKINTTVDVYVGLCSIKSIKTEVQSKLAGMLLHPFPTVRNKVADVMYTLILHPGLVTVDWSKPPNQLKTDAHAIRLYLESAS